LDNPIGVFDSGVGGLTVVRELIKQLPLENIIYLGDTARVPYGPRPLVIACNTATAAGLAQAQAHFDVPVVGVIEPGARGAVQATRNRRIGVIGTAGTIDSGAYTQAIRALDAGVTVYSATCPKFVEIVEKGMISDANFLRPKTYNLAKAYLTPLLRAGIDSMILGCTHYPLLADLLGKVAGSEVELISSAAETAIEVKAILERRGQLREGPDLPIYRFAATLDIDQFAILGSRFLERRITEVESIDLKAGSSVEIS